MREHLDVDAGLVHLADAQLAHVLQPLAQLRVTRLRSGFREVPGDFGIEVVLFESDDLQCSFQRARARRMTFSAVRGM